MTPKAPLKPGDRIKFVGPTIGGGVMYSFEHTPQLAEVRALAAHDKVYVFAFGNKDRQLLIHRRQVTHILKPKAKELVRAEQWCAVTDAGNIVASKYAKEDAQRICDTHDYRLAHLTELFPGERPISKEALAEALEKAARADSTAAKCADWLLKELSNELGLESK